MCVLQYKAVYMYDLDKQCRVHDDGTRRHHIHLSDYKTVVNKIIMHVSEHTHTNEDEHVTDTKYPGENYPTLITST